ncbi:MULTISPECIES: hypothetical protein [unclassified Pantoea]|uniref:hypothetical protein n=1 Tax=unclassified Pantoea TaxID=2630326 RepID=UPI00123219E4|nr:MULTISPECIES: hypothetical protein [unclassified Pantoea]KAA5955285.1 hypothetical protein F3I53_20155 [Pantoea sp. VH_16]KAA6097499.1 hypothetical protein F3I25_23545 [Pantoea sp. Bo_14]KAA6105485.1 hypothetical protein F3I23_20420 [Pantoea sp. Bo_11]
MSAINFEDATLTAKLHVAPDFTGRVIAYFEKGELKADMRLRKDELTATLDGFLEFAKSEGWTVCPPPPSSTGLEG